MSLTIRIADKCSQKNVFYRLLQMNLVRCYKSERKIPFAVVRGEKRRSL